MLVRIQSIDVLSRMLEFMDRGIIWREGVFTTTWSKIGWKLYTKLKTEKHTKMENSEISDTVKSKCKYLLEAQTIAWQKSL